MSEWIKKLADDIKEKDAAAAREDQLQLHRAKLIEAHSPRFFSGFCDAMERDLNKLRADLGEDITAGTIIFTKDNAQTFNINRPALPFIQYAVAFNHQGQSVTITYAKFNPHRPTGGYSSQPLTLKFSVSHQDHVFLEIPATLGGQPKLERKEFHHPDEAAKWLIELLFTV